MHWTRITAALVIISLLFGCASFSPIGIQTSPDGDIQLSQPILPGDRVRLVMKSGETSEFRAVVVEQNRVSSESTTYELKDVESIEVFRAQDERSTLIVVVGIIAIVGFIGLLNEIEDSVECTFGNC